MSNVEMFDDVNTEYGTIYKNKYGDFVVIAGNKQFKLIKFINLNSFGFNTIKYINKANILANDISSVIDPYLFNSCDNNACLGMPELLGIRNASDHPLYWKWSDMMQRCYMKSCKEYAIYGALGVTTIYRWRCYEYFVQDAIRLPNFDKFIAEPSKYAFDKDMLQRDVPVNNRIYSPQTCMFIEKKYNLAERNYRKVSESNEFGYVGITKRNDGTYDAHADRVTIGVYKDPEAAAYAYNKYMLNKDPNYPKHLLNNVPELSVEELFNRKILRGGHKK